MSARPGAGRLPRFPVACVAGCGRTARRIVRVRELHVDRDADTGAELGRHVDVFDAPFCRSCGPPEPAPDARGVA